MFISLLAATFAVAFCVSWILAAVFRKPMDKILARILDDEISHAWELYLLFAIFVVGISSGVRPWELERYISPETMDGVPLVLNAERWVLEIYRTVIGTLEGVAWMLLVFFIVTLIVFAIVRMMELRKSGRKSEK
jgi:hypothetical protein